MACYRVAGAHKLYYAARGQEGVTYLGMTGDEGVRVTRDYLYQDITSDELGPQAIVDHVYQGSNLYLEFVLQELNFDIVQQFLHPFQNAFISGAVPDPNNTASPATVHQERYGVPGRLGCAVMGTLEVLPVAFSPAEAFNAGSASGTAGDYPATAATSPVAGRRYKGIVTGSIVENLDSSARFVPVRFQCYPFLVGDEPDELDAVYYHWTWIGTPSTAGL